MEKYVPLALFATSITLALALISIRRRPTHAAGEGTQSTTKTPSHRDDGTEHGTCIETRPETPLTSVEESLFTTVPSPSFKKEISEAMASVFGSVDSFDQPKKSDDVFYAIEKRVQMDEGKRGIRALCNAGELLSAAGALLDPSVKHVLIITGFPCHVTESPPTETDGPSGAFAIAKAMLTLGHSVTIATDECNEEPILVASAASGLHRFGTNLTVESFPPQCTFTDGDDERLKCLGDWADIVVSVERPGPTLTGDYLTMNGVSMSHLVAPLEDVLMPPSSLDDEGNPLMQSTEPMKVSIGIGDGGNEVGMGKVMNKLVSSGIPNAETIGCIVPTTHLIVSSVSDWGAYGLTAAIAALARSQCLLGADFGPSEIPMELYVNLFIPLDQETADILQAMVESGARDGITKQKDMTIDGFHILESMKVLEDLRSILVQYVE